MSSRPQDHGTGERARGGQRVNDRYRLVRELGAGAFGTVYVAEDEITAQRVAIRFLPAGFTAALSPARATQGIGRSSGAAVASHPELVRVLEHGETEPGRPYIVMELVEGRRLSELLSGGEPLDFATACGWAVDLGSSVEALHNMGLVHGALSPRNVMVLADGRVKLMDVELAGLRDAPTSNGGPAASAPAEYLSPEQIRQGPVTEKTDVYAFAAMVYATLCGAPPFEAPTREAVLAKHLSEPPTSIRRRWRAVPPPVERIITQALAKDPELRPWMNEMVNGLWEEPNSLVPARRGWKRSLAIVGGAAVAASLAVLVIWGGFEPRPSAVSSFSSSTPAARVGARPISSPPASAPAQAARPESAATPPSAATSPVVKATAPPAPVPPAQPGAPPAKAPGAHVVSPAPPVASAPQIASTPPVSQAATASTAPSVAASSPVAPATAPVAIAKATPPPAPPTARAARAPSGSAASAAVTSIAEPQPQRRTYRVGWLDSGRATAPYQDIVKQALVGYPRDIAFEYRSAEGRADRLPDLASELVHLKVDIVFAVGNQAIQAARQATSTIPIVMVGSDAAGGRREDAGNVTGVAYSSADLSRGWLKLLKEVRPTLSRAAVLYGSESNRGELASLQAAAANAGVKLQAHVVQGGDALGSLFAGPPAERAEAIIVPGGPMNLLHLSRIVDLAGRARVPTVYGSSEFVDAGGLFAYGPSTPAMYRRAGAYIGKILGPADPRDLPVEQPSRFELVINLKTARALGVTLPASLVLRADRVVQ